MFKIIRYLQFARYPRNTTTLLIQASLTNRPLIALGQLQKHVVHDFFLPIRSSKAQNVTPFQSSRFGLSARNDLIDDRTGVGVGLAFHPDAEWTGIGQGDGNDVAGFAAAQALSLTLKGLGLVVEIL